MLLLNNAQYVPGDCTAEFDHVQGLREKNVLLYPRYSPDTLLESTRQCILALWAPWNIEHTEELYVDFASS